MFLLGILAEVYFQQDHAPLELVTITTTSQVPVARVRQMLDLGIVFKAFLIVDTVEWFLRASGTTGP